MKTFIPNPDDADTQIRLLETKLGLTHGPFIENIDDANIRVEQLEAQYEAAFGKRPVVGLIVSVEPSTATTTATEEGRPPAKLTGIDRALAASQGIKTQVDAPKPKLFGIARAMAAVRR
jgi:hypothetical protein